MSAIRRHPSESERRRSRNRQPTTIALSHGRPEEGDASWVADDICTLCGAVAPRGKLYCSSRCRDEDGGHDADGAESLDGCKAATEQLTSLRYPMTLSPHLTAQTNPVPMRAQTATSSPVHDSVSDLSSDETPDADVSHPSRRREPSTSPWQSGLDADGSGDDISDLEENGMGLPPPLARGSGVSFSRSTGIRQELGVGSFNSKRRLSTVSPAVRPRSMTHARTEPALIQFSRMPAATNLPASVGVLSPALPGRMAASSVRHKLSEGKVEGFTPLQQVHSRQSSQSRNDMASWQKHRLSPESRKAAVTGTSAKVPGIPDDPLSARSPLGMSQAVSCGGPPRTAG